MVHAEISPEDRLCLCLAAANVQSPALEHVLTLLQGSLCWDSVLDRVRREGISPLFFHNVRRLGLPGVPSAVRQQLQTAFKLNAARNACLAQELGRVIQVLGEAGIPVIPLKGVALAESLYGDTAMRVCGDLDILVPRHLVARSFQVLLRSGYDAPLPEETLLRIPLGNAIEYELEGGKCAIHSRLEVHWGLFCGSRNDERAAAEIWLESRPATFFGAAARRLTPAWEFLYLAAHAARHLWQEPKPWGGVKWLADLNDALYSRPLDWEQLRGASRRHGWELALKRSLRACHSLFGADVPQEFLEPAPHHRFPQIGRALPQLPGNPFFVLRDLGGGRNQLSFLLRRVFLPNFSDYTSVRLPRSLSFLYYLLRPFRLAYKCGLRFIPRRSTRARDRHE
jgi:hypothetical protein